MGSLIHGFRSFLRTMNSLRMQIANKTQQSNKTQ